MASQSIVLCAVDLGPLTSRVVFHAVGFARVMGLPITVIHVAKELSPTIEAEVTEVCAKALPDGVALDDVSVIVRTGDAADVICSEAAGQPAALMVLGTCIHSALARLLLGSTCARVLERAEVPVLLVPPSDLEIVRFGDGVSLACNGVMAAVDLSEDNTRQINMASRIAQLGGHVFSMMTVARKGEEVSELGKRLQEYANQASPMSPVLTFVRTGDVIDEIAQCAGLEGAGLVVMGLRDRQHGKPGRIAASVLRTGESFVLVVPHGE